MKKVISGLFVFCVLLFAVLSCKTPQAPKSDDAPEKVQPEVEKVEEIEEVVESVKLDRERDQEIPKVKPLQVVPDEKKHDSEVQETVYIVKNEDTLSQIAEKFYGSRIRGYYFPIIMASSPNVVKNPDIIYPGMKLHIPNFDQFMSNSKAIEKGSAEFKKVIRKYRADGRHGLVQMMSELHQKMLAEDVSKLPQ